MTNSSLVIHPEAEEGNDARPVRAFSDFSPSGGNGTHSKSYSVVHMV
jgi:hypothetical protein